MQTSRPTSRLAYDDADTAATMAGDCAAVARTMHLPLRTRAFLTTPAPSLRYEDFPREVSKRDISVDAATAHLAAALELHLG
ncbi:hypothetical protein KLP28_02630 [Nocardioidaceae bacterium]|nr:hypothetical protein KLP28_02630 [Nocardioidaceae bacterium]